MGVSSDYEKEIYNTFITKYIKGESTLTGEEVKFNASDYNKTIRFTTGVTEEGFKTNKEANQFVYLFTYDMDASYEFIKFGTGKATSTISNTATVTYDGGLNVEAKSSIKKDDFLTKADITPDNEAKTSGKKTYRLTFDFTGYELKGIKEIEITDTFREYDKFVDITGAKINGALKEKQSPTDPDEYEAAPAVITFTRDGKVFKVNSDVDLSGKKFTIIYEVKMDLSKIFAGGQGERFPNNMATAILKNDNNPPQTIKESATASTEVQYGKFLTKTVNTWAEGASADDMKAFKESAIRHYTLTFDLKDKDFLKSCKTLEVKDTFGGNHGFVKYDNIVVNENGTESTNLSATTKIKGSEEIVFEVKKTGDKFPDSFTLEYDVILKNSDIIAKAVRDETVIYNKATATFKGDNETYTQDAQASTPVRSGSVEVVVQKFYINLQKVLPKREIGRDKFKPVDYTTVSFELKGKYKPLDKQGNELKEEQFNSGTFAVSSNGSLILDQVPFNGTYTLKETVAENADHKVLKDSVTFTVSKDGKTITFKDGNLEKDKVEVTSINDNTYPATINQAQSDGSQKQVPNPALTNLVQKVGDKDAWGFVINLGLKVYNELKPIDKHTLIFKKIDTTTRNPLQYAVFKIEKLGDDGSYTTVSDVLISDAQGLVRVENLENGKYKVTETNKAPGRYTDEMAYFTIELTKDMAAEYDYGDVTNQKLTLHNISFIKADSVKDENGKLIPLSGAEFKLMKKGSRNEYSLYKNATSDSDGKVTFRDVPEGIYKIVESKAPVGYGLPEDTTVIDEFDVKADDHKDYYDWSYKHEIRIFPPGYRGDLLPIEVIEQKVVENKKIKHSISFTKYQEVYKGKPIPMAGATFILKAGKDEIARAKSDDNGLVKFENLDNKQYHIVEAHEDKEKNINVFKDHVVNTDVINVPDLTNARDKAQNIKLFTDEDTENKDEKFVNYKDRKGFSFKKYDEALDDKGQPKVMKGVEFKAYRKVGNNFEKEVYKHLNGQNPARDNFKYAVAVSDAEGNVVFTGFEPGTYKIVETRVAGYENLSFEIVVSKDGVKYPKNIEDNSVEKVIENADGTQKNEKTYIVKNSYTRHEVTFKKVDKFSKMGLEGAVFKVEKLEKDGTYTLVSDKVTSNAQGLVSIPGLFNGEYRITEIKTPSGYKESDVSFKFKLSDSDLPQVVMKDVENEKILTPFGPSDEPFNKKDHSASMYGYEDGLLNKKDHSAYMYGYKDGSFRPKNPMTRAEVTAMFGRLLLKKYTKSKEFRSIYPDVKKEDWFGSAVTIMTDLNLVKGYPDGTFKPNAPITRAEFSTIASKFDKIVGGSVNFKDLESTHWAYKYIASAYQKGWIKGYPDGTFRPERNITREEVVTITNLMLDRKCDLNFVKLHKKEIKMFYDNPETSWSYGDIIESTNGHDYHRKYNNSIDEIWERLNGKEFHI